MLLIFDWDGTLCDSTGKIVHCIQSAAKQVGLPCLDDSRVQSIIGLGLPEAIRSLYPSIPQSQALELRQRYIDVFMASDAIPSGFFDGVEQTLTGLKERGHTLCVATGKSRRGLDRVLNELNARHFFSASRCADETASKPNPLMLYELLEAFNVDPANALMVGDTTYDLDMANTAKIPSIAVTYGAHSIETLLACKPVTYLDKMHDLLMWLDKQGV